MVSRDVKDRRQRRQSLKQRLQRGQLRQLVGKIARQRNEIRPCLPHGPQEPRIVFSEALSMQV